MKSLILVASIATISSANPQHSPSNPHAWRPPGPNDFRGPCPMLNTLANHAYLPHNGRNITKAAAISGLKDGLNFNGSLAELMWSEALVVNPSPNATLFTLDQLNAHNVLEHDASLTRQDATFGNNHVFNERVYKSSQKWWTSEKVTVQMLANSKIARQVESRAFNPGYTFTVKTEEFSLGEVAAPIIVFGDMDEGTVERGLMEYFFENERLPEELGWTKKKDEITLVDILRVTGMVRNATRLITGDVAKAGDSTHGRRDLHAGLVAQLARFT